MLEKYSLKVAVFTRKCFLTQKVQNLGDRFSDVVQYFSKKNLPSALFHRNEQNL